MMALLVDRKGFQKWMAIPYPPPPVLHIADSQQIKLRVASPLPKSAKYTEIRFRFKGLDKEKHLATYEEE